MSDEVERDEYSVVTYTGEDRYRYLARFIGGRRAIEIAKLATDIADMTGVVRVIVTDGGDHIVFEWKVDEGVTFPPSR